MTVGRIARRLIFSQMKKFGNGLNLFQRFKGIENEI
jgi:hypothetical protein